MTDKVEQEQDWADAEAVKRLPCRYDISTDGPTPAIAYNCQHDTFDCPAFYRPSIAISLRAAAERAHEEGFHEGLNKAAKYIVCWGLAVPNKDQLAREVRGIKPAPPTSKGERMTPDLDGVFERLADRLGNELEDQGFLDDDGTVDDCVRRLREAKVMILAELNASPLRAVVEAAQRLANDPQGFGMSDLRAALAAMAKESGE